MSRLLIAHHQRLVLEAIRALFSSCDDVEIVGDATCSHDIFIKADALRPDIVFMEATMPYLDGTDTTLLTNAIETTFQIKQIASQIKVIILTAHPDEYPLTPLLRVGVSACVLKKDPLSELRHAMQVVSQGGTYFSQDIRVGLGLPHFAVKQ